MYLIAVHAVSSIVAIAFDPNQIAALYFGVPFVIACYVVFWWRYTRRGAKPALLVDEEAASTPAEKLDTPRSHTS